MLETVRCQKSMSKLFKFFSDCILYIKLKINQNYKW